MGIRQAKCAPNPRAESTFQKTWPSKPGPTRSPGALPQHIANPNQKPGPRSSTPETYVSRCKLLFTHNARIIASGRRLRISSGDCSMSFN